MAKCKVKVVTAFVPIAGHPRSLEAYGKLGEKLDGVLLDANVTSYFDQQIPDLWLTKFLEKLPPLEPPLKWAKGDNPQKNTLEYHCVQHQKFAWLARAANEDQESDTFVWMDFGICSQPGITTEVVQDFLKRIKKNDFAMPGCWPPVDDPLDEYPCWRFCGSLMIVPRTDTYRMLELMQALTRLYIRSMKQVTFEVNMLARAEKLLKKAGLRWYQADHNAKQFANYQR
jgi:hypothetical protein